MRCLLHALLIAALTAFSTVAERQKATPGAALAAAYSVETITDLEATQTALFPFAARANRLAELAKSNALSPLAPDTTAEIVGACSSKVVGTSYQRSLPFISRGDIGATWAVLRSFFMYRPVVWDIQQGRDALPDHPPQLLPLPAGSNRGIAVAANDAGQIIGQVGFLVTSPTAPPRNHSLISYGLEYAANPANRRYIYDRLPRSILWDGSGTVILPALPKDLRSIAYGINNRSEIVGQSVLPEPVYRTRAVMWRQNRPVDLNTLVRLPAGEDLARAFCINDAGQILALCTVQNGPIKTVLLTPIPRAGGASQNSCCLWSERIAKNQTSLKDPPPSSQAINISDPCELTRNYAFLYDCVTVSAYTGLVRDLYARLLSTAVTPVTACTTGFH